MEAYRNALGDGNTTMVLSPDSAFFNYFGSGGALPDFPAPTATPIDIGVEGPSEQPIDSTEIDDLLATDSLVSGEGADLEQSVQDLEQLLETENLGSEGVDEEAAPAEPAPDAEPAPEEAAPAQ